jgi:hypothetical protein
VPAFTAYIDPDANGARVSQNSGVTGWRDSNQKVLWFGEIKTPGTLDAAVELRLPENAISRLRLTVAGQSHEAEARGTRTNVTVRFGKFEIKEPGYQRFALEALNTTPPFGDPSALVLEGVTTNNAHFNLKPRRNAASVHLNYPVARGTNVAAFYCEVTGLEEPVATYYEACGWQWLFQHAGVNSAANCAYLQRLGAAAARRRSGRSRGMKPGDTAGQGRRGVRRHSEMKAGRPPARNS